MSPKAPTLRDPECLVGPNFWDDVMPKKIVPEVVSGKTREDRSAAGVCRGTASPPITAVPLSLLLRR
jgi:hypothetical protein